MALSGSVVRLRWSVNIERLHRRSPERQLLHTLHPQQPRNQHTGGSRRSSLEEPLLFKFEKICHRYRQCLLAGGWRRQPDDGPLRWDGPQRDGGGGKDEDPCQREEEGPADGLDKEVRAVQQLLRRSLPRIRTRACALVVDGFHAGDAADVSLLHLKAKNGGFTHSKLLQTV